MAAVKYPVGDTGYTFTRKALTGADVLKFSDTLSDGGLTFEKLIFAAIDAFVDKVYHQDGGAVDPLGEDWHLVVVPLGLAARASTLPAGETTETS